MYTGIYNFAPSVRDVLGYESIDKPRIENLTFY
jgi:hypothetical protein